MAWAWVRTTTFTDDVTYSTSTFGLVVPTVTVGNLLVLAINIIDGSGANEDTISSITDSAGNTWAKAVDSAFAAHGFYAGIWYAKNISGTAPTLTVHLNVGTGTSKQYEARVLEYSGLDTVSPLDVVASLQTDPGASYPTGTTATTAMAGELAIAIYADNQQSIAMTVPAGWNSRFNFTVDSTDLAIADLSVSVGTQSGTFTSGTSHSGTAMIATFKLASSSLFRSYLTEDRRGNYVLEDNSGILLGEPLDFYAYTKESGGGRFLLEHSTGVLLSEVPDPDVTVFYGYIQETGGGHFLLEDGTGILINEEPQSLYGALTGTTAGRGLPTGAWGNKTWGAFYAYTLQESDAHFLLEDGSGVLISEQPQSPYGGIWGQWGNALTAKRAVTGTSTGRGLPTGAWGNKIWGAFYAYTLESANGHLLLEDGSGALISEQPQPIYGGIWGVWGNALTSSVALTGTGAGAGDSTGTLTSADALTGTSQGVGGGSGAISMSSGAFQVTGTSQGTGGSSATLTSADALTGTTAGTGGSAATLSDSEAVTSTSAGVGGSSATLTAKDAVTSTGAGTGGSAGTLASADALTGLAAGAGGSTGTLTSGDALTGTTAGAGGSSSTLLSADALTGTSQGVGGGVGNITSSSGTTYQVTGTSQGTGGSSATLTSADALTSITAGTGGSSATLADKEAVTGSSAGAGGSSGTLKEQAAVSGTGVALGGYSAALKAADTVSGTGSGTGGSSANLTYSVLATLFYRVISREPATAVTSQTKD